ncbi:uncharacterized protein LOC106637852 [Copidosoma floridanum]|uniref:uncharacterized protein LOC106637852 n=1 Tax=Copidosoma floridanum TaxID=29053 RepID=UPI0006C9B703|nr:uncharacterized protein LOC106637852 [Copidosoma floridanum]
MYSDVNMVAEPKLHQTGRKRQNMTKTGNDWDYYYNSYYTSTAFPLRLVPPLKRARLVPSRPQQQQQQPKRQKVTTNIAGLQDLDQLKVYSNPDILICGNCREMFTNLGELLEHKRDHCKQRFTCKCHTFNGTTPSTTENSRVSLLCVFCKDPFPSAWELMVHAQAAHMINIYEISKISETNHSSRSPSQNNKEPSLSFRMQDQDNKGVDELTEEDEDLDRHVLLSSPDSGKSTDNENTMSPIKINGSSNHKECKEQLILVQKNKNKSTMEPCFEQRSITIKSNLQLNTSTANGTLSNIGEAVLTKASTNSSISLKKYQLNN